MRLRLEEGEWSRLYIPAYTGLVMVRFDRIVMDHSLKLYLYNLCYVRFRYEINFKFRGAIPEVKEKFETLLGNPTR